jgi:hypothetical protein
MRRPLSSLTAPASTWSPGTVPLAAGLVGLIAVALWPSLPGVTAMSLVALGATEATFTRFRDQPVQMAVVLLHCIVYAGLFALFVGATIHAGATSEIRAWIWLATIDLAVSLWPCAVACERITAAIQDRPPAK